MSVHSALLKKVPFFAELSDALLEELAQHIRRRVFAANETLFHEGDPGYILYVIVSGRVKIQRVAANGKTLHVANRGPGEYFGEMALIDGKPRMADAVTAERCDLLMLDRSDFVASIEKSPQIAFSVMACLAERLRQSAGLLDTQATLDVLGRVAAALLELAEVGGVDEREGEQILRAKVSQQELAEQIGTTRESVNRALASLKAVKAIRTEGRQLVIRNPNKLRQACEP